MSGLEIQHAMSDKESLVQCCVCLEEKPDSQICGCPAGEKKHALCAPCAREMVEPGVCSHDLCCGLHLSCPICRVKMCVSGAHLLHVIAGCEKRAGARFKYVDGPARWASEFKRRRRQGRRELRPLPPSRSN